MVVMSVQGEVVETHSSYWREQLAGAPTRLELPTDKPRPAVQTFRGGTESFALSRDLMGQLKGVGIQDDASLFMVLEAGFVALLHRYTGQDDILVGTPIETESLIGVTVNTVVLRSRFSENLTFRSLLRQTREQTLAAHAHSDHPFEQLVADLVTERELSHSPLFQAMFALSEDGSSRALSSSDSRKSKYDLTLALTETANGLEGTAEYSTDLFEAETIRRFCGHYTALLSAIAGNPDQSIAALPMLTDRERNKILVEWNDTRADFPSSCVHQLFEQQVALLPDAAAVIFKDRRITYRELNDRANQVASYLRKKGLQPESLVGVCLERSPEMLVVLLGIWKAGGAYVPMDPSYPKERLAYMLRDAAAKFLVTDSSRRSLFSKSGANVICIDSDWSTIAKESPKNLDSSVNHSNLAYVMYTSGSTGEPKGVMVLHGGLVNYLTWAMKAYAVASGTAIPVHTSISFDLTVTGMYPALLAGGSVEILPEDVGGQNLVAALRAGSDRSLVKITPAHLALLGQQFKPEEAAGRTKLFVIGGENLLAENLGLWREFAPDTRLINEYGPTETVVGCCVYELQAGDPRSGSVPIGRPIANTQLYILDRYRNPVPVGVVGELYIGGAGVARGYLNRTELTRERFIADPFSKDSGARLYKTGDLARYRPDGILEYYGRVDNQVKVRGYRIELGEIEGTLSDHPNVKTCAVLAREDEPGNKQLVGYVSLRQASTSKPEELRQFLKDKLPEYMVPSQIVILESIPLTHNGKIDRKALPAPSFENVSTTREFIAPQTETEKKLAAIWSGLLKVQRIGIHDDFFDLGGHSLMAIKAVSQIRDVFGVEMPLATLLEAPTIAGLAKILSKDDWMPSWSSLVPIRPNGTLPRLFLFHAHGGNVLEYHALVNGLSAEQPVYAFQARGLDGNIIKDPSVEKMAAAYVEELQTFQPQGPYFLGGFCLGGLLALEAAEQLTAAGHEVALVIMIQSMHPDASRFRRGTTALHRAWHRTSTRIRLELDNLAHSKKGHVLERSLRAWNLGRARAAIAFDKMTGHSPSSRTRVPMMYIFESLGMEHSKAMKKYVPGPYSGDVLLFRVSEQLSGLVADNYLGWKGTIRGNLDVCEVPGYQQNVMLEPHVARLAQELDSRLRAAQQRYKASRSQGPGIRRT